MKDEYKTKNELIAELKVLRQRNSELEKSENVFDLFPKDIADRLWKNDRNAQRSNFPIKEEESVCHKDGVMHTYFTVKFPLKDGQGNVFSTCAISIDITERKKMEEALQESEKENRILIDNTPFCIHQIGLDGRFLSMNSAGLALLKLTDGNKIIGILYLDVVAKIDKHRVGELLTKAYAAQRSNFEFEGNNGCYYSSSFIPITNAQGDVVKVLGVSEDITDRKRVERRKERELQESEEQLRLAVEGTNVGLWDWDLKTDRVAFSSRWATMLGYIPEELGQHITTWERLVYPEDKNRAMELIDKHFEDEKVEYRIEFRMKCKDGSWKWIFSIGNCTKDAGGKPIRFIGLHLDISERKQAEEALRESERRYRNIFSTSPISIWEEDFSAVKPEIEEVKAAGVTNFRSYLDEHPEFLNQALEKVKILDMNTETLKTYGAKNKEEFLNAHGGTFVY